MRTGQITWAALPLQNLKRSRYRSLGMCVIIAILTAITFGASVVAVNLSNGLDSLQKRMGADIMIVPTRFEKAAEDIYLCGDGPKSFFFKKEVADLVKRVPGVAQVTPQTYIASLNASCCDVALQIIGIDPRTDFVIEPWIHTQYSDGLKDGEVVVGSRIQVGSDGVIKLFGHNFPVSAKLASTGTSLDVSVFANPNTIKLIIRQSGKMGRPIMPMEQADSAISALMVKADPNVSPEEVSKRIQNSPDLLGVGMVSPNSVSSRLKAGVSEVIQYLTAFLVVFWIAAMVTLIAASWSSTAGRKKELASLRIMGVTKKRLTLSLLKESLILALAGGIIGLVIGFSVLLPFSNAIQKSLKMPYISDNLWSMGGLALVALGCATVATMLASGIAVAKMFHRETYLVLREGQ